MTVRTSGIRQPSIWASVVSDHVHWGAQHALSRGTSSLHVVASDSGAVMQRALNIGATVVTPLVDQTDYPSRDFTVADPDGSHWTFATFAG